VFTDMAVAIADGADCVSHIEVFGDRHGVCGPVASMPTTWRLLDRIDDAHVPGVLAARAAARERAWAAGAAPDVGGLVQIDFDATTLPAHRQGHDLSSGLNAQGAKVLTCQRLPDPSLPDGRLAT
jgi:hypothetical protein